MFIYRVDDDIALELIADKHAEPLFAIVERCRDHLGRWLGWVAATGDVDRMRQFCRESRRYYADTRALRCAIVHRGDLVGTVGLENIDQRNDTAEIGYWLDAEKQGKGIAFRSARAMTDIGFREYGLHRIYIRVAEDNHRSRAIPERLGYLYEGTLRQCSRMGDRHIDLRYYAVLAPEWTS